MNPFSFNGPKSSESLKTVTTNETCDLPPGIGASRPESTVLLPPVGFTVAALLFCWSSMNPKMFAASTFRFWLLSAVAVNRRQTVFFLFGMYWFAGHSVGSYLMSLRPISEPKAEAMPGCITLVAANAAERSADAALAFAPTT